MESPQQEEKMDVYLKMIKTVAFKVNKSSKIKDLKSSFYKKEGVEENLQELFYNGQRLTDEEKLADHGIGSYSTLNLYVRGDSTKLFVKIPPNDKNAPHQTIVIEPTLRDTVKNIKYLIQKKEGVNTDSYALFYNGKSLEDNATLASLNIPNESVLRLIFTPSDSLSVMVELASREVLKLEVKYLHRILDVKEIISSMGHFLVSGEEDLSYEGKRLDDDLKTVASYDIKPNSTLKVLPCTNTVQIFVKFDGKSLIFTVNPRDTILNVKTLIGRKVGLPNDRYSLQFCGKLLREDQSLAKYNIQRDSTLYIRSGTCGC